MPLVPLTVPSIITDLVSSALLVQAPFVPVSYECSRGKLMKNLLKGCKSDYSYHLLTKYYKQVIRVGAVGWWFTAITLYTWYITDCN